VNSWKAWLKTGTSHQLTREQMCCCQTCQTSPLCYKSCLPSLTTHGRRMGMPWQQVGAQASQIAGSQSILMITPAVVPSQGVPWLCCL
jgi:hypothetical protein